MSDSADGWWVRQDLVWVKRNGMSDSTRYRPTTSHEYWFLCSKGPT